MNTLYMLLLFFYYLNSLINIIINFNYESLKLINQDLNSSDSLPLNMKRVCYYAIPSSGSWDKTLKDLNPEDIDPFICTHITIAFAKIQNSTIQPKKVSDVEIYKKVLSLKKINPELKVMLSLNSGFQNLVKNNDTIKLFAHNAAQFLHSIEFDGLDLDWEFPGWPATQNNQIERSRFTHLVQLLRNNFKFHHPAPFILSLAVAAPLTIISRSYEISKLAKEVDFLSLMCYDYHLYKSYLPLTGFNSPLHKGDHDISFFATLNIEWTVNYWVAKGAPKHKLVVGIPTYGRTWKLLLSAWNQPYALAADHGMLSGYVSYPEALKFLKQGAVSVFDDQRSVPYSYLGRDWVSYEDRNSIYEKALWIKNKSLAGVMSWNLNCDDFQGIESGRKFDLHKIIYDVLKY